MSVEINGERYTTFSDYMNDETKVSKSEKKKIERDTARIGKYLKKTRGKSKKNNCKA